MPSLLSYASVLALAGAVIASPTHRYTREQRSGFINVNDKKSTFTVNQVASSRGYTKISGLSAVRKAMAKFGGTIPDELAHIASVAATNGSGTVAATPEANDVEYLAPVTVGNTVMELDFDTGSADLWVFSSLLPSNEQTGHALYGANSSGTVQQGQSWKITYGDNSGASGVVYADKVAVGGVTATKQAVEAATSISTQFTQDQNSDGLLGLAFSSINTITPNKATTFFDTVKANLDSPVVGVTLKKGAPGSYDFGFIDKSKYTGDITYVDVDSSQGFWEFTATGYTIGSGQATTANIDSIMDTGTSLWFLPNDVVEAYYKQVQGAQLDNSQGGYTVPCSADLPDMSVTISGQKVTVPGSFINYASIDTTNCFGGIQASSGVPFAIFGDIFMKSKYVVFDGGDSPRLGIASQAS